jgi:hypothetical protein
MENLRHRLTFLPSSSRFVAAPRRWCAARKAACEVRSGLSSLESQAQPVGRPHEILHWDFGCQREVKFAENPDCPTGAKI